MTFLVAISLLFLFLINDPLSLRLKVLLCEQLETAIYMYRLRKDTLATPENADHHCVKGRL